MSEVKRYDVLQDPEDYCDCGNSAGSIEVESADGEYVRASAYDAALLELAALREELAQSRVLVADQALNLKRVKREYESMRDRKNSIVDLQQRLTAAEQRNSEQRGLLHRALNVIRGMRYDELEAAIVEALNIKSTESGASE